MNQAQAQDQVLVPFALETRTIFIVQLESRNEPAWWISIFHEEGDALDYARAWTTGRDFLPNNGQMIREIKQLSKRTWILKMDEGYPMYLKVVERDDEDN